MKVTLINEAHLRKMGKVVCISILRELKIQAEYITREGNMGEARGGLWAFNNQA